MFSEEEKQGRALGKTENKRKKPRLLTERKECFQAMLR